MYRFAAIGLLVSLTVLMPSWTQQAAAGETLVISTINNKVKKFMKRYGPLAKYLEHQLADQGVDAVKVSIHTNRDTLVRGLRNGEIDIYLDSPLVFTTIGQETGLRPALRSWKKGVAEYHSVFFTSANSSIQSLDDLQGQIVTFQEATSTSGYLLPKAKLLRAGYRLSEVTSLHAAVASNTIGYLFSQDDDNTILWTMKGKAAAGVVDSITFKNIAARRPGDFRVIARSESVPRHVIGYRSGLDPEISKAITRILQTMHTTEAGQAVQKKIKTSRFDQFPHGIDATFARMAEILVALDATLTN